MEKGTKKEEVRVNLGKRKKGQITEGGGRIRKKGKAKVLSKEKRDEIRGQKKEKIKESKRR